MTNRVDPVVTLYGRGSAHPKWLDGDFWIRLDAPERFAAWAAAVAPAGADRVVSLRHPNRVAFDRYARRLAGGYLLRSLDSMLTAHVLSVEALPDVEVTMVTAPFAFYELDRLLVDVLAAPRRGVARADVGSYLAECRRAFYASRAAPTWRERAQRRVSASVIPLAAALPRSIAAVYSYSAANATPLSVANRRQGSGS